MSDDPYDMRANSVYKLREELAFALTERDALRAENARLEKALTELTEENRLVGLQMDRFADEIERLREALNHLVNEVSGSWSAFEFVLRQELGNTNYACVKDKLDAARAAMGDSND